MIPYQMSQCHEGAVNGHWDFLPPPKPISKGTALTPHKDIEQELKKHFVGYILKRYPESR
jgi:hypothetical protein